MPEDIKQEVVLKTQKYLGKYVKKPVLSDKLLRKPPFRFLHDVITTVIKETGFLKGLFTDEELNSENVKDKDAKLAFLTKLIDAVKAITKTDLAVRPTKIVAGLEPTETNLLLQTIAKAIDKKIDSREYTSQLHTGQAINNEKNKKSKKNVEKNEKTKKAGKAATNSDEKIRTTPKGIERKASNETPKSTDRDKSKTKTTKTKAGSDDGKQKAKEKVKKKEKAKESAPAESVQHTDVSENRTGVSNTVIETDAGKQERIETSVNSNKSIPDEETIKTIIESLSSKVNDDPETPSAPERTPESETRKRGTSASRPKSARPRSGDIKHVDENKDPEPVHIQSRPKSSLRPPSVRPSSARPGAPRLRPDSAFPVKEVVPMGKINVIIESFDKDDEEETVIIQSNPETAEEHDENIEVPANNKGHLVEQILEQINESDGGKAKNDDWQKEVFHGKDTTTKETTNLRSLIQSLTKTANPLGKLLNYLHEDIDAMHAELESWTNTKRQLFDEISKQKKISLEMNKPLVQQLDYLNHETKKIEEEIVNTRSTILRNDIKIKELLSK